MFNQVRIKQYSVWLVALNDNFRGHEQNGTRPFFVVSKTAYNTQSSTAIGFFCSTSEHKLEKWYTYQFKNFNGGANITQIRTLDIERFIRPMATIDFNSGNEAVNLFLDEIIIDEKDV